MIGRRTEKRDYHPTLTFVFKYANPDTTERDISVIRLKISLN